MATVGQYIEKNGRQYKVIGKESIGKGYHFLSVQEVLKSGNLDSLVEHIQEKDGAEAPSSYNNIGRPQKLINY